MVSNASGNDVTSQFTVKTENGTLTINPVAIELTAASDSKEFDDSPLTNSGYSITGGAFVGEEGLASVTVEGSRTYIGSSDNTITAHTLKSNTKAENYSISYKPGTLTITDRTEKYEITVKANSGNWTYDGQPHTVSGFEQTEFTVDGHTYTVSGLTASRTGTNVSDSGAVEVTGTAVVSNASGNDVTSQFTVKTENGTLTIKKRPVNLSSESATKVYDTTPLTRPNVTGGDSFISGEVSDIKAIGTITNKGTVTNTITYTENAGFNADNYIINKNEGTLTIIPVSDKVTVTVTENSGRYTYDNTAKSIYGYKSMVSDNSLYDAKANVTETSTADWTASGIDAGEYPLGISAGDFQNINTNFINVEFKIVDGSLVIDPISDKVTVTVTENSGKYTYDGTARSVTGYKSIVSDNSLYNVTSSVTETSTADWTASGTDAGEYPLGISADDFQNVNTNFSEVKFVIVDGKLEISKIAIELTAASDSKEFDDSPLTNSGYSITGGAFVGEEGLASVTVEGSRTYIGSSDNTITAHTLKSNTKAENYSISYKPGTLTVTPVRDEVVVRISGNTGEFKYDGTEKSVSGYKVVSISNPLYTEDDFTFNGSEAAAKGTNVNTYNMGLTNTSFTNENLNFTNVSFVVEDGSLTITPRSIILTSASDSKVYDANPLTNDSYEVSGDGFVGDDSVTVTVTGSQTDAGSSANTFTYTLSDGVNADNYSISKVEGILTVNKRPLVVSGKNATRTYNGEVQYVEGISSIVGLVSGHSAHNFTHYASGIEIGDYAGTFGDDYFITDEDGNNVTDNYDVSFRPGILRIYKFDPKAPPKTGDESQLGLWLGLMTLSALGGFSVLFMGRKRRNK